jgi:predicted transcriptional regulator
MFTNTSRSLMMAKASTKKPAAKNDSISAKGQAVLDYLSKHGATTAAKAIERSKVWKACEVGMGVISTLKAKGLLIRVDHEDGTKLYQLTAEGKKLAAKESK